MSSRKRASGLASPSSPRPRALEKAILRPRQVDIQVLGDREGNLVHLLERDGSIQRRRPCPAPSHRAPRGRSPPGHPPQGLPVKHGAFR
ncbi:hypothetical protein [Sorangium sp. So ce119]|uniref:ATP-binding protein n=1 Tax=Sorangium sp. So ce119 TaxID=3133279 RepID=UPI003F5F6C8D